MSNSLTMRDLAQAPSFAPQVPMAQNDNPQAQQQQQEPVGADPAQMVAVQAAEMSIFSFGMAAFDGGALSFAHAATTANSMMNVAQTAEIGAATMDLGRGNNNPSQASNQAQKATQITQAAAFTPSEQQTGFSMNDVKTRKTSKNNDIQVSFSRPSDTDGARTRGVDLSAPMNKLANSFKAPTLSPR